MYDLRPWKGYDGLLSVMIAHLNDYIPTEEKYGISEKHYKERKVAAARETVRILKRMKNPDGYLDFRRKEVKKRYPKYKSLVTKDTEGTCFSGDFVAQGDGWVGKESGKDPREGYFEFVNGRLQLAVSPDQIMTDKLLLQIDNYRKEISNTYVQAEADSDKDFERLTRLLKAYMYMWLG